MSRQLAVGENLESTARRVRYEFFAEVAAEVGATWIATGHTADDQAETVLHRLIRGTGLQGLRGIACGRAGGVSPPSQDRRLGGLTPSARPVVYSPPPHPHARRDPRIPRRAQSTLPRRLVERRSALHAQPHPPRTAAAAEDVQPGHRRGARAPRGARRRMRTRSSTARGREVLAKAERPRAGNAIILDVAALGTSRAVIRAVLRLVWEREGWPMSEMDFDAWDRAVEVACGETAACDFPGGISHAPRGPGGSDRAARIEQILASVEASARRGFHKHVGLTPRRSPGVLGGASCSVRSAAPCSASPTRPASSISPANWSRSTASN